MLELFITGLITALGAFALLCVIPVKMSRLMGYIWFFDIFVSIGFVVVSIGTYSGTVSAFVAGLTFSVLLRVARWWYGAEVFDLKKFEWRIVK